VKKSPNPIDIHVGGRLRLRRMLLGWSQEKLGGSLGLTFQQIQKYEKGTNRVSASRLYELAQILNVPVQFFYDDLNGELIAANEGNGSGIVALPVMDYMSSNEGVQLNRAYFGIESTELRKQILSLVKTLSAGH
jgi:transcriptional regulator with XRE-family HTH domain